MLEVLQCSSSAPATLLASVFFINRPARHIVQNLSQVGQRAVSDLSIRYNLSPEAVEHMLVAVNNGGGSMAQFNSPELGGGGQWMSGGMTMVGDMFNHGLKSTVDSLCNELSSLLANNQVFPELPTGTPGSNQWWPDGLGSPFSSGGQNNSSYALFAGRLAVQVNGEVTVYDTLDHQIGGVSQQQGGDSSLAFTSQYGTVMVSSLPVISGGALLPLPNSDFTAPHQADGFGNGTNNATVSQGDETAIVGPASVEPASVALASTESSDQVLLLIEKLAQLHSAGVLSDEEFGAKKQELLSRL